MSLKENMEMVKEELNSEEKFFEKSVITERFIKKYKNVIIGTVVAVVIFVGANIANNINEENKIKEANKALMVLSKDATNSQALLTIKEVSPNLYDVWLYSNAVAKKDMLTLKKLANSKATMVGDLANYELSQDAKSLESYALRGDAIYKDLALVQSAILLMGNDEIDKAHTQLQKIPPQSSLNKIASALLHYGVK